LFAGLVEFGWVDPHGADELVVVEDDAVDAGDDRVNGQALVFDTGVDLVGIG
jgi:hypothetical protein